MGSTLSHQWSFVWGAKGRTMTKFCASDGGGRRGLSMPL